MAKKRRILGKVVLPFSSKELLQQFKKAMRALQGVVIPPPYSVEDFARLLEHFPLLASPLSALRPSDCRHFWEFFGVWLLEKGIQPEAKALAISPSIGAGAHRLDIEVLAFASHHPWPSVIWRDIHCYRCACLSVFNRNVAFAEKCSKHRCQTWATQLLNSHSPVEPKWAQFSDIGRNYGAVVAFQASSEEELFCRGDDSPIRFTKDPVLAWSSDNELDSEEPLTASKHAKESSISRGANSESRRKSVNKPLQFLEHYKRNGKPTSKHRRRDFQMKMKKGGSKYKLVDQENGGQKPPSQIKKQKGGKKYKPVELKDGEQKPPSQIKMQKGGKKYKPVELENGEMKPPARIKKEKGKAKKYELIELKECGRECGEPKSSSVNPSMGISSSSSEDVF